MRIEAPNLDDAFLKAAKELNCSVTELNIEILQHPSGGMLGFFKKNAIIEVSKETDTKHPNHKSNKKESRKNNSDISIQKAVVQIKSGVQELIKTSCFDLEVVCVKAYNEDTILIELNGNDAALLIGKEGYRYKAFSYLLYNWINIKYGFGIRLEVAQFLKNQEISAKKYITPVIERIKSNGRGQTKPLDGVWIKIALELLRKEFPEKYVGIKTSKEGAKYIVVNDFNKK